MKKTKYSSYLTINFIPSKYLKPEKRERGARKVTFKKRRANEKYVVVKIFMKTVIFYFFFLKFKIW